MKMSMTKSPKPKVGENLELRPHTEENLVKILN